MRDTRFYQKKGDGKFFAKLPKDADPSVQDGRELRPWTFGDQQGESLGYVADQLSGRIESVYVQEFKSGDRMFCVGLQHADGVDVFQCDVENKWGSLHEDVVAFALRWRNIDLQLPVTLLTAIGKPKGEHGFRPVYLNVNQAGRPVWPHFDKAKEGRGYEGVPDMQKVERLRKVTYDSTERDEFLWAEIEAFMKAVEALDLKSQRQSTPAEAAKAQAAIPPNDDIEEDEDQVPF